jgi:hypothetical protein
MFTGNCGPENVSPVAPWNAVIPPGATNSSVGFCANRIVSGSGALPTISSAAGSTESAHSDRPLRESAGRTRPHDDPDGWHLLSPNQLSVDGAACEQIQAATDLVLDISFPCGLFIPS